MTFQHFVSIFPISFFFWFYLIFPTALITSFSCWLASHLGM